MNSSLDYRFSGIYDLFAPFRHSKLMNCTEHTKEKIASGNWWTFTKMLEAILRMSEIEDDDERGLATLHLPQKFCNYLNFEARKFKQCKL